MLYRQEIHCSYRVVGIDTSKGWLIRQVKEQKESVRDKVGYSRKIVVEVK